MLIIIHSEICRVMSVIEHGKVYMYEPIDLTYLNNKTSEV